MWVGATPGLKQPWAGISERLRRYKRVTIGSEWPVADGNAWRGAALAGGAFAAGAVAILAIVEGDPLGERVAMDPKDDRRF